MKLFLPLKKVEVVTSNSTLATPGSTGFLSSYYYLNPSHRTLANIAMAEIIFNKFGKKGKDRITYIPLFQRLVNLDNVKCKCFEAPTSRSIIKRNILEEIGGKFLGKKIQVNCILKELPLPKNLLELDLNEFLAYITAFSSYLFKLDIPAGISLTSRSMSEIRSLINSQLIQFSQFQLFETSSDINEISEESIWHYILTLDLATRKRNCSDSILNRYEELKNYFNNKPAREEYLKRLQKKLAIHRATNRIYFENTIATLSTLYAFISDVVATNCASGNRAISFEITDAELLLNHWLLNR
jgi:hypothetical protein